MNHGAHNPPPALLFPILVDPRVANGSDVELQLGELIAAGLTMPTGFIRVTSPQLRAPAELTIVGHLQGQVICRFVRGVIRAFDHATVEARYSDGARHNRDNAERLPVRMNG